jgi:hypothetical protein
VHELHLLQLEARRVREGTPLEAAEVTMRARALARRQVRVRAGPPAPRERPQLTVVRARKAPAKPAGA